MSLEYRTTPAERLVSLRSAIEKNGLARLIEAHNGLSALVGQAAQVVHDGATLEYDGFWESSLTDSASKGLPDAEIVGSDSRSKTIDEILAVTSKPMIVDGDTGGSDSQFEYFVRRLERMGVSGVIIEDKVFPKRNSLDPSAKQTLEDPERFARKLQRGIEARIGDDFLVIARLESLIAGVGMEDALSRAERYVRAGVAGIMIHSKREDPDDILDFAAEYERLCSRLGARPLLVSVPTTYNLITDVELADHGFDIVIHANHLLRAAHRAMVSAATAVLEYDRGFEAEPLCSSVQEVFSAVGFAALKEKDKKYLEKRLVPVIIPAAGKDPVFPNGPKSLIEVNGKPIIAYQLESIRKAGLRTITVVGGHEEEQLRGALAREDIQIVQNTQYEERRSLHSVLCAEDAMEEGFVLIYSDILFRSEHLVRLLETDGDIVLLLDGSYQYHRHEIDKRLDLVVSKGQGIRSGHRTLRSSGVVDVSRIGKDINVADARYEFVGIARFSRAGAETLRKVYRDCLQHSKGRFHEAESVHEAGVTDMLQEIVNRRFEVQGLEVFQGWMEIHSQGDVAVAEKEILHLQSV